MKQVFITGLKTSPPALFALSWLTSDLTSVTINLLANNLLPVVMGEQLPHFLSWPLLSRQTAVLELGTTVSLTDRTSTFIALTHLGCLFTGFTLLSALLPLSSLQLHLSLAEFYQLYSDFHLLCTFWSHIHFSITSASLIPPWEALSFLTPWWRWCQSLKSESENSL